MKKQTHRKQQKRLKKRSERKAILKNNGCGKGAQKARYGGYGGISRR